MDDVIQKLGEEKQQIKEKLFQTDVLLNNIDFLFNAEDNRYKSLVVSRGENRKARLQQLIDLIDKEIVAYRNDPEGEDFHLLEWAHLNRQSADELIWDREQIDDKIDRFSDIPIIDAKSQEEIDKFKAERKRIDDKIQKLFREYKEKYIEKDSNVRKNRKTGRDIGSNEGKTKKTDEFIVEPPIDVKYLIPPLIASSDLINIGDEEFKKTIKYYQDRIKTLNDSIKEVKSDILSASASGDTGKLKELKIIKSRLYKDINEFYENNNKLNEKISAEVKQLRDRQKNGAGSELSDDEKEKLKRLQRRSWELTKLGLGGDLDNNRHKANDDIPSLDEVIAAQRGKKGTSNKAVNYGSQNPRTGGHEAHNRKVINRRRDLNNREKEIRKRMAKILGIPVSDNIENEYEHDMRFQLEDWEVDEIQELREELKKIKNMGDSSGRKSTKKGKARPTGKEEPKTRKTLKRPDKNGRKTYKVDIGMFQGLFLKFINFLKKFFKEDGFFGNMLENAKEGILASGARVLTLSEEGKTSFKEVKDNIKLASRKKVKELQSQKAKKTKNTKKTKKRSIKRSTVETIKSNVKRMFGGKKSANKSANKEKPKVRTSKPKIKVVKESNLSEAYKHDLTWIKEQVENTNPGNESYERLKYRYEELRKELNTELNNGENAENGNAMDRIISRRIIISEIMEAEGIGKIFKNDEETIIYSRLFEDIVDIAKKMKIDIQGKPIVEIWNSVLSLAPEYLSNERYNPSSVEQTAEYKPPEIRDHSEYITAENIQLILEQKMDQNGDSGARLMYYIIHEQKNKLDKQLSSAETKSQKNKKLEQIKEAENILDTYKDNIIKSILAQRVLIRILELADEWELKTDGREMKDILGDVVARYGTNCVSFTARGQKEENEPKRRTSAKRTTDEEQL